MPTLQELFNLMEQKSDDDLRDMFAQKDEWSDEAIRAARQELLRRGKYEMTKPELGPWGSDRIKPQKPKIRSAGPRGPHDCEYCGDPIQDWGALIGDTKKVMVDGKPFHDECARLNNIFSRVQGLTELIEKSGNIKIVLAIDNCFFAYRPKYDTPYAPNEYVGMLVLTSIGVLYLARDFSLKKIEGSDMMAAGYMNGGIGGMFAGAFLENRKDIGKRKRAIVLQSEKVDHKVLLHHAKASIDAHLFPIHEIKQLATSKDFTFTKWENVRLHAFGNKYSFIIFNVVGLDLKSIIQEYTRQYIDVRK